MRDQAITWLKANYSANFAPKPEVQDTLAIENPPPSKKAKLAGDVFLYDDDEPEDEDEDMEEQEEATEVDQYLLLPQLSEGMSFDLLAWWKKNSIMWPNLSRMARQYLALPASSAAVERLFSSGGQMHGNLRKNTKEDTLHMMLYIHKNG
jgi:hypothetical protein